MRLKEVLNEKGITAKKLAELTGLTEMGVSKIVNGKSHPNEDTIKRIANVLEIPCGCLFDDYEEFLAKSQETLLKCPKCGHRIKLKAE